MGSRIELATHAAVIATIALAARAGDVDFYTSEAEWDAAVECVTSFPFTASNMAEAVQVPAPPPPDTSLGAETLFFPATATDLPTDLEFGALAAWYYGGLPQYGTEHISPGSIGNPALEDWTLSLCPPLQAAAFTLFDNSSYPPETEHDTILVYGASGLLDTFIVVPFGSGSGTTKFIGIVASEPIEQIVFRSGPGGDDFGIADLRLSCESAAPCTLQPSCADADLNGNGGVDGADLGILLGFWGIPNPPAGDLDGNGSVDGADLGLLLSAWGPCPSDCPGEGSCCEVHGSAGCDDALCCDAVCTIDAFCCDFLWDAVCANKALAICQVCACGDAAAGDCCEPNGTPYCDDAECCDAVCAADLFCCENEWDDDCANQAILLCEGCGCGNANLGDCCEANGTPYCDDADCCEAVCAVDSFCCDVDWDGICAEQAAALCTGCGCGNADVGNCCEPKDTPYCDDVECCEAVCVLEPLCCTVRWDEPCAEMANELCAVCEDPEPACGVIGTGACCSANDTPYCDDSSCCETVCAIIPFCCDVSWDAACASAASVLCELCSIPAPCEEHVKLTASDAQMGDRLGQAVGISGNVIVVGQMDDDFSGVLPGSAYLFDAVTGAELAKVVAFDASPGDGFGLAVAISDQYLLVGAPWDNGDGSAYLYDVTDPTDPMFLAKFVDETPATADRFGASVALSGTRAVVGAPWSDGDTGAAYVYDAVTGELDCTLTALDGEPGNWFGHAVAIEGDDVLVGAVFDNDAGTWSGSAYLFDVSTCTQVCKLTASNASSQDQFGAAVAIDGGIAVIGAYVAEGNTGLVYVFDVETCQQLCIIDSDDTLSQDDFGWKVDIRGDVILIYFTGADDSGNASGAAYLFSFDGACATQCCRIVPSDNAAVDVFGRNLALGDGVAVIASYLDDDACPANSNCDSGSAYVFGSSVDCR